MTILCVTHFLCIWLAVPDNLLMLCLWLIDPCLNNDWGNLIFVLTFATECHALPTFPLLISPVHCLSHLLFLPLFDSLQLPLVRPYITVFLSISFLVLLLYACLSVFRVTVLFMLLVSLLAHSFLFWSPKIMFVSALVQFCFNRTRLVYLDSCCRVIQTVVTEM